MIVVFLVVLGLIVFITTSILYKTTGRFKRFYHDVLQWHEPVNEFGWNGCSMCSCCKYCGEEIMMDSQGNWF